MLPTILDATAGNRTIWKIKQDQRILWVDVEPDLDIPPDILMNCVSTGFPNKHFHTIIFDPPHEFGRKKNTTLYTTPSREVHDSKWPQYKRKGSPRYYGNDKYKNEEELLDFISRASIEFNRILQDDDILLLKWSERRIKIEKVISLFPDFVEMMRTTRFQGQYSKGGIWVLLMKRTVIASDP